VYRRGIKYVLLLSKKKELKGVGTTMTHDEGPYDYK